MTHAPRRRKKSHDEEHENHERWLVSYADMVTLLMCLFIILFAMSQIDQKKYDAFSNGLSEGFGQPMSVLDHGINSNDPTVDFVHPLVPDLKGEADVKGSGKPGDRDQIAEARVRLKDREKVQAEAKRTYNNLAGVRRKIDGALRRAGYANAAHYQITSRGLVVSIIADQVLFDSARADLKPAGAKVLRTVAPALQGLPNNLAIEGHTNHLPLASGTQWPSDWELSTYRATTVLRYLSNRAGLDDERMFAAGYSDTRPLVDPSKPAAITQNRRVDIVVLAEGSSQSRDLLPGLDRNNRLNTIP